MQRVDFAIRARWVVPVEPAGRALPHHAVVVHQGRIAALMPADELLNRFEPREIVERPDHLVIPGLVNAHARAGAALFRGAAAAAAPPRAAITQLEERWLDPDLVRDGCELAIADMLATGTTCFADTCLFPEVTAAVASQRHIRACVGLPVSDQISVWAGSIDEYLAKGLSLHDDYRSDPLIHTAFAPRTPHRLNEATLTRMRRAADEIELPVMMPVHASALEVHESLTQSGERPLARYARLGLATPLLAACHMTTLNEEDLAIATEGRIGVVHCPLVDLREPTFPYSMSALSDRGATIALGTAGPVDESSFDLLAEMRTLFSLGMGEPYRLLEMATLNGARTLGTADANGSILPGKSADLCAINLRCIHAQPVYDPVTSLAAAGSRSDVTDVWVAGRHLIVDGKLPGFDVDRVIARATSWADRIAGDRAGPS
jgi:5-methylthioadenosine/S-adenosylhomocysteine deaminase